MTESIRIPPWVFFLILALLWHLAFFVVPWSDWLPLGYRRTPPPIPLTTTSPEELAALKRAWREKALLLNQSAKDKKAPPPKDARFFSESNRNVEKEVRARNSSAMPQQPRSAVPQLSQLAVPLPAPRATPLPDKGRGARKKDEAQTQTSQPSTPSMGMDQSIIDPTLPEGSQNLLNTEESVHYSFYSRVYEAVAPLWQDRILNTHIDRPLAPKDYRSRAVVSLDAKGNLLSINFITASGVEEFDQAFTYAWKKIQRFPNPPAELLKNGRLEMGWNLSVEVRTPYDFIRR